ncbi:MAG: hypothetical protein MN733_23885 [Nitrososphaera sp.]|nr:hypothetical protein [Nitrososphaera sp.]
MKTSDVAFSENVTNSRRLEVFAALSTLIGMFPEHNEAFVKDSEGNLYSCERGAGEVWQVYEMEKMFRDGFFMNADERALLVNDQTIAAVKSLRNRLHIGLCEAKMHCDFFKRFYYCEKGDTEFTRPCNHTGCVNVGENYKVCNRCGSFC